MTLSIFMVPATMILSAKMRFNARKSRNNIGSPTTMRTKVLVIKLRGKAATFSPWCAVNRGENKVRFREINLDLNRDEIKKGGQAMKVASIAPSLSRQNQFVRYKLAWLMLPGGHWRIPPRMASLEIAVTASNRFGLARLERVASRRSQKFPPAECPALRRPSVCCAR